MVLALISITMMAVLATTFLITQSTTTQIGKNVENHATARLIAESGLTTAIEYIRVSDTWREDQSDGLWLASQDYGGGSFRILFEDEDGDLDDDSEDPVTVTVTGKYDNVTHTVRARITPADPSTPNRLLYVAGSDPMSDRDKKTVTLIESWGYTVTTIEDSDTQANYDAAVAVNDVIYISEESFSSSVHGKIEDATLGIINEEVALYDDLGFISSDDGSMDSGTDIKITDNTHDITNGLELGTLTVASQSTSLGKIPSTSSMASGVQVLAQLPTTDNHPTLTVIETGGERSDGSASPGRRVNLCFSANNFDPDHLNDVGEQIMLRSIQWAAGDGVAPSEPQLLALYEFNEVAVEPELVGHWELDDVPSAGGMIVSRSFIKLLNNTVVDGYYSTAGAYGGSNVSADAYVLTDAWSPRRIKLTSGSQLNGHAYAGQQGGPGYTFDIDSTSAVTGRLGITGEAVTFPSSYSHPTVPSSEGNVTLSGTQTLTADRQFNKLTVSSGATVTIDGQLTIVCNNDLVVGSDAQIILSAGSSLALYVDRNAHFLSGSQVNADSTRTEDLEIYMNDQWRFLTVYSDAVVAGIIKSVNTVDLKSGATVYGNIFVRDDCFADGATIHLDHDLPDLVDSIIPPVTDAAGSNDGEYVGGEFDQGGAIAATGKSVRFDGSDDYIEIPHHDDYLLDAGALSLWFKTENAGKTQAIFSKDSKDLDTGGQLTIMIDGGYVKAKLQSTTQTWQYTTAAKVTSDTWHHLVFTWGPNRMRLYLDKTAISSLNTYIGGTGDTSGGTGNYEPIVLGADASASDDLSATPLQNYFIGNIDDVRIYDQALDPTQVQNLYAGNEPGTSSFPGYIVEDTSNYDDALNMTVQDTAAIAWVDGGGLTISSATQVISDDTAAKIHDAIEATDEMAIEVVFTPANLTQTGPARLVTYSNSTSTRNFTLGQSTDEYRFRLRTDNTGNNGTPDIESDSALSATEQHVVVTYNGAEVNMYQDGSLIYTETRTGDLSWDDTYHLIFGAEADGTNGWLGTLSRVAIYDRAFNDLQADNVYQGVPPGDGVVTEIDFQWNE